MLPLTSGFQCGAPNPVRAGITNIFSSWLALAYSELVILDSLNKWSLSLSHWIADPATNILPS